MPIRVLHSQPAPLPKRALMNARKKVLGGLYACIAPVTERNNTPYTPHHFDREKISDAPIEQTP